MGVHIGKEIERKYNDSGLKIEAFAKAINTGKRNVYSIFKRADINVGLLQKIGAALEYDFLSLYESRQQGLTVNEPGGRGAVSRRRDVVPVIVELDGAEETLMIWRERLELIHKAMQSTTHEPVYHRPRKHA